MINLNTIQRCNQIGFLLSWVKLTINNWTYWILKSYIIRETPCRLAHLISRSSTCSDDHRERGKVLERHKAAGTPVKPGMKINKTKKFKYMSRRTKDNDRFKLHKLNLVKTIFFITFNNWLAVVNPNMCNMQCMFK